MKNVWILNHYAQEPGGPGGTRHYSLAKYLVRHGWAATIIAASVELNTNRQRLSPGESQKLQIYGGIPFLWLRTNPYSGNGIGRVVNMLGFTARSLQGRRMEKLPPPDVIIGSSVHPLAAWAGAKWADRLGVPFIFEVRDLWPETLVEFGQISRRGIAAKMLYCLEKDLYQRADGILVLLPHANKYIVGRGIPIGKIHYLPNGVDLEGFHFVPVVRDSIPFKLMYFGAHGQAQDLSHLLRTIHIIKERGLSNTVSLRLIGDGPLKPALQEQSNRLQLRNVTFEPPVPKNAIPSLASEADGFVLTLRSLPNLFRYGVSMNKLFDYMAAGRPVVTSLEAGNNPILEADAGFTVPPDDPHALADAIIKLASLPLEQRIRMGRNARMFIEKEHDFSALAERLSTVLSEVTSR